MIQETDGMYLNQTWVAPATDVATTFTGNDLTKPAVLNFSHTNEFHLPDLLLVRGLLANAEQLDSGEDYPYQRLPAPIVTGGETILSGVAGLMGFSNGWDVALLESGRDLFPALDQSIRTGE